MGSRIAEEGRPLASFLHGSPKPACPLLSCRQRMTLAPPCGTSRQKSLTSASQATFMGTWKSMLSLKRT